MRGMELKNEMEEARNYIFYVSDYIDVSAGHAWKMDCRQAMTEQMVQNLPNCKVMKYTEYHGERLDADSVGILFPSKMWGISLAVYAFLQNLRVSASTYVYAVAMGEVLSAEVNGTANVRMETLGQFQDIFERRRLGDISDIYIRCIDYKREFTTTEEKLMRSVTTAERIADVMEGLLFYSMKAVKEQKLQFVTDKRTTVRTKHVAERKEVTALVETKILPMPNIKNVFLDDDLLSEVRICQAM
jgi:hypothetical protein